MGQKLTQTKSNVAPEVETFLYKYLPQLQFVKKLSDNIFLKTSLLINEYDGEPLICKIYFKRDFSESESKLYSKIVNSLLEIRELYNIETSPNVAPILIVNDSLQKAGLIIRQYFSFNLKERISSMPYLTQIEKKWISFQIIYGLFQIHNKGFCHGDIKLENILLSSNGSVFLCDLAPYKPAYIQQDDVGSFTYYFGTNSSIKSCYLAPERLVDKHLLTELSKTLYNSYNLTTAMDIFSVGAVIAELFLEEILFDHPKLLLYKTGKFNHSNLETALKKIKDKNLEQILIKMLHVNPAQRIELSECLKYFGEEVCPISFSRMLIHFNTLIVSADYWKPDKRIGLIYKYWKQIFKVIYGVDHEIPELSQSLNNVILNEIILDNPFSKYYIENFNIIFDLQNDGSLINESIIPDNDFKRNNNSDSVMIIVNLILSAILSAKYSSSKIVAMEILRIFSFRLPDITKIQLIIPYMVKLVGKDQCTLVRYTALSEIINILNMINENELILPSSDYNFFDAYIFPAILELYSSNEPSLILAFANIIDKLTDLEQKFLNITLRSRFHNMKTQNVEGNVMRQTFTFHTLQSSRDRGEEIIHAYDTDLYEFKMSLFKIIEDVLSKNEDLDIQQILIRKLPNLMLFYGRRESNNFSKFIIALFNKKDWLIQTEILKSIPSLIVTLGETALNQFIVPCMELIIYNNLNEIKIYEMIHTMHLLLKMEYVETFRGIDLFKKILPYIMHPNLQIRNEVINFAGSLINLLSQGEIYTYLRSEFKNYMFMPFVIITLDLIKQATKERLSRVIYELESKDISYYFQRNFEDLEAYQLIEVIINAGKESNRINKEELSESNNNTPDAQLTRLRASLEGISVTNIVKKEFSKFIRSYTNNQDDVKFIEKTFLGKLISLSNILESIVLPLPQQKLPGTENILSQENFRLKYLFKTLDIVVKQEVLDNIDIESKEIFNSGGGGGNQYNTTTNQNKLSSQTFNTVKTNANSLMTMAGWKPQGRLLATLYDHDNIGAVERLLNLDIDNKFLSFGTDGHAILWDVISNENDVSVDKLASHKSNIQISYGNSICSVENNQFAMANKNELEVYRIENLKSDFYIQNNYQIPNSDENEICSIISNYKSQESRNLVYCNQKGLLHIYDLRVNKTQLKYDVGVHKGLITCIDFSKDHRSLYLGSLGGYILHYDFRLNSVIESYKYNDNTPIIGLKTYLPCRDRSNMYDLYSMNLNSSYNNYILVWTAASDHELGLWNLNTINCDAILKVNPIQGKEVKALSMEIPTIEKENLIITSEKNEKSNSANIENLYRNLVRYSAFNSNAKNVIFNSISSKYYSQSNKRFSKLSNMFDVNNTVQIAFSPINNKFGENMCTVGADNVPYILSAGNDMTIRYWDISRDSGNTTSTNNKRSYLINAPNKIDNCVFTTSNYDSTVIMQSNENINTKLPKRDISGFSEYQNYNGVNFHLGVQNEFDEKLEVLKYCTKVSDASHKNAITDMITVSNQYNCFLFSSSWDGSIKMWK